MDTRFHETLRRWKRHARSYERAALLGVALLAVVSACLTARIKEAAEAAEQARKAGERLAEQLREEADRRAGDRLVEELREERRREALRREARPLWWISGAQRQREYMGRVWGVSEEEGEEILLEIARRQAREDEDD
jgi:hypothetical protein